MFNVANIEHYIRDKGSAAGEYFNLLDIRDHKAISLEFAWYAVTLVTSLMGVKAERDKNNLPLENDAPPVML